MELNTPSKESRQSGLLSDEWSTPDDLFAALNDEFHFTVDVAASWENTKCPTMSSDSLDQDWSAWGGVCWMNPPYSRGKIGAFVKKAYEESLKGITIVTLVRADTSTNWWNKYITKAAEIRFLKKRVKFKGAESCYNFPCAVVVFGPYEFIEPLTTYGWWYE